MANATVVGEHKTASQSGAGELNQGWDGSCGVYDYLILLCSPLSTTYIAIACPSPKSNSSLSHFTISPAFTPAFICPLRVKPFFSAIFLKSSGPFPVFVLMLLI